MARLFVRHKVLCWKPNQCKCIKEKTWHIILKLVQRLVKTGHYLEHSFGIFEFKSSFTDFLLVICLANKESKKTKGHALDVQY